jgi:hypothetical protein
MEGTHPTPCLRLPDTARAAPTFYRQVSRCSWRWTPFRSSKGPMDRRTPSPHGGLHGGPVQLMAADAGGEERPFRSEGLMF